MFLNIIRNTLRVFRQISEVYMSFQGTFLPIQTNSGVTKIYRHSSNQLAGRFF